MAVKKKNNVIKVDPETKAELKQQKKNEEAKAVADELRDKINKMVEDRNKKLKSAKDQLVENLKVTADKYRTATGVMEALRVMRMVNDGTPEDMQVFDEMEQARSLAALMVVEVSKLVDKAEKLGYGEMGDLCKDAYKEDFISDGFSALDLCAELMRLDLCRNIGPAADDMVSFIDRVQEEIDATSDELVKVFEENPEV